MLFFLSNNISLYFVKQRLFKFPFKEPKFIKSKTQ